MLSIGLDTVDIKRFMHWQTYSHKQLKRIFTQQEILYCLNNTQKSAERFAARFAAKEAFYKAINPLLSHAISFFTLAHSIEIIKNFEIQYPNMHVLWENIPLKSELNFQKLNVYLSITHTHASASAVVIIA